VFHHKILRGDVKMAMQAKLWTMNGLSTELRMDRRKLGELLSAVPPDGKEQGFPAWRMSTAVAALNAAMAEPKGDLDYNRERTRLAREQADKLALENAVARGELLPAAEVAKADEVVFTALRDRVPHVESVTPVMCDLAVVGKPGEARQVLRQALRDALEDVGSSILVELQEREIEAAGATP
jgi:hypothetical protein